MATHLNEKDIEKYRTEHECDEHWELRRKFLLTYKDKYPEDELICLAQVFINVELLGCSYPKETMRIIAELSDNNVVSDFREKHKSRLQRTFIGAKQAAENKTKGRRST